MSTVVAFDADVVIYAATPSHHWRAPIRSVIEDAATACVGSVLLLPETLAKPTRFDPGGIEVAEITSLLARVELRSLDSAVAQLSVVYGADFKLRAADAVHLATAVAAGADAFLTNNRKDFPKAIPEIEVLYPEDLSS